MAKISFDKRYVTKVPTECIIEDIAAVKQIIRCLDGDPDTSLGMALEEAECLYECLVETLNYCTDIPKDGFAPSESSAICMCVENGLMLVDGKEPKCMGGLPMSDAWACDLQTCQYRKGCNGLACVPEKGVYAMQPGIRYTGLDDESVVALLAEAKEEKEV